MLEHIDKLDKDLFWFIHLSMRSELLDLLAPIFRNKNTWIPFYIWLGVYVRKEKKVAFFGVVALMVLGVVITDFLCAKVLKDFFERSRPCVQLVSSLSFKNFGLCSDTYSMPSCHAANHAFIAGTLILLFKNKIIAIPLVFWVLLISFSQVYVGVHFPGDVIIGMIVGGVLSFLLHGIYNRYKEQMASFSNRFYK